MRHWILLGAVMTLGACNMTNTVPPRAEPRVMPPLIAGTPQGAYTRSSPGMGPGGTEPAPPTAPTGDTCGADQYRHLVGRPLPQPFTANGPVRIFTSGHPVTMDHNPARLNIEVDASSQRRIVTVSCG